MEEAVSKRQKTFAVAHRSDEEGAVLAYLDPLPFHDLVIWTDGSVSFPFGKGGSGVLANCSLYGTKVIFFFSAGTVC